VLVSPAPIIGADHQLLEALLLPWCVRLDWRLQLRIFSFFSVLAAGGSWAAADLHAGLQF
jgi:hypothetical protein